MSSNMNTVKFWIKNSRYHALPQSLIPALLAVFLARRHDDFQVLYALLAVFGVILAHLGVNLFDDFFDYLKKEQLFRDTMAREGMRARVGKCAYLISRQATLRQLFAACLVFCGLAVLVGLILFLKRGEIILAITAAAAFLGIFYSAWPIRLSYRGLGELTVAVMFGPLLMYGMYYSACGYFDPALWFLAIPIGLLATTIVFTHSILDAEPDKKAGKITFAVLLGNKWLMLTGLIAFVTIAYLLVFLGIQTGFLPKTYLMVFLTLPLAVGLFRLMFLYIVSPHQPVQRKFWMGPMNAWKQIVAQNIDWFMIRWYVSRNLLVAFCLTIVLASLLSRH